MTFVILFVIFIIFIGLAGSVLRKKLYKKLLSLSLSFNALIVFTGIVAYANESISLKIFCICSIFVMSLVMVSAFYICRESRGREIK